VALAFLSIVICGYLFGWKWTGVPKQTFWDWLSLLIVPAVLAVGGFLFTRSENQRTLRSAQEQREVDREIAKDQAETDRTLADERRQDDTLQAYLDGMSQLLTDKDQPLHSAQPGDSMSTVARARTLTVLERLDSSRKKSVLQFLYESGLNYKEHTLLDESDLIERQHNIVSLQQADLREATLTGTKLIEATLIEANLSRAELSRAELREANLLWASLGRANLSGANLVGITGISDEKLEQQAASLEDATMPNGQKYEDWLNDRE
jgi:Pentapeptide repeats (8 copies)